MSLYSVLQTRIAQWSQRRHGIDAVPFTIGSRRVYILPTKLGVMYAVIVVAMGIGGMNYANNLALMLAFLLASLGIVAMHHCQRNLVGITVHTPANAPVFAGQHAVLRVRLNHEHAEAHVQLQVEAHVISAQIESTPVNLLTGTDAELHLSVPSTQRGWLKLPRITVSTRYPFGLFRAWTVLHLPLQCLIYPRPSDAANTPPPLAYDSSQTQNQQRGDDEFSGFRTWQSGDSPKRIAWKLYARGQGLHVQQHAGAAVATQVFDWHALQGLNTEMRLSRLTRWIIDADRQGIAYGLKVPDFAAMPGRGDAHLHRCLATLALFNGDSE
jgi:uncharacterized protein (DUF58 family)